MVSPHSLNKFTLLYRNVAQFGSAYRLGRWGQEFESLHSETRRICLRNHI